MTQKQRAQMREAILQHGFKLQSIFPATAGMEPVTLCKALRRWEGKAHRLGEDLCNTDVPEEVQEHRESLMLRGVDKLLGFTAAGVPVIINLDPRGYGLKIPEAWVREHNPDIYRDWGGYGILAPDFTP